MEPVLFADAERHESGHGQRRVGAAGIESLSADRAETPAGHSAPTRTREDEGASLRVVDEDSTATAHGAAARRGAEAALLCSVPLRLDRVVE